MTEEQDKPLVTLDQILGWAWSLLRAVGVIFSLMAILWFLGKVN